MEKESSLWKDHSSKRYYIPLSQVLSLKRTNKKSLLIRQMNLGWACPKLYGYSGIRVWRKLV
jgi:hypothetical protein